MQSIGGIPIGTQGSSGIYSGYTMVGGDDFVDSLNVVHAAAPLAKYFPTRLAGAGTPAVGARLDGAGHGYYMDPFHVGNQDSNRGVAVGAGNMSQSGSTIVLQSRIPGNSTETAAINSVAVLDAGVASGAYLTFTPPCIIEFYEKFTQSNPAGWHPTSWIQSVDPFALGSGAPGWQEYDFPEVITEANYNAWGTVTGGGSTQNSFSNPGSGFNLYSLVLTASNAKFYVNGTLVNTVTQDTTNSTKPFQALLTSVTDGSFNLSQWTSAGANGPQMTVDYYRIWLPNAQANQILQPTQALPIIQANFNTALTYTFPSAATLWGSAISDFPQAAKLEDMEPGAATTGSTGYSIFPSDLSYNSSTRILSGTVTSRPGRIHTCSVPYVAGGSLGYTARGYIDIGPNITTGTINLTNGVSMSHDLYPECDCGTLLPKVITCTGLPTGLSFSAVTGLITGTPTVNATTSIAIRVTNSSGQTATTNVNIVVSAAASLALDAGTPTTVFGTTQTIQVPFTAVAADCVLILIAKSAHGGGIISAVSDDKSLTWVKRAGVTYDATGAGSLEIWYAKASGVYSGTVSVTQTVSTGVNTSMTVFGIAGSVAASPPDANASLPKTNSTAGGTSLASAAFSTTSANTFIISAAAVNSTGGTITPPTGFTSIVNSASRDFSYKIVSAAQVGITPTVNWVTSNSAGAVWDAIQEN